jgi:hypothetical protein
LKAFGTKWAWFETDNIPKLSWSYRENVPRDITQLPFDDYNHASPKRRPITVTAFRTVRMENAGSLRREKGRLTPSRTAPPRSKQKNNELLIYEVFSRQ